MQPWIDLEPRGNKRILERSRGGEKRKGEGKEERKVRKRGEKCKENEVEIREDKRCDESRC